MGKKKKTPLSKIKEATRPSESPAMVSTQDSQLARRVQDFITVHLTLGSGRSRGSDSSKPTVWMHDNDMSSIDVEAGEDVIAFALSSVHVDEENISVTGMSICKVAELSKSGSKSSLTQGLIQMSPSTSAESFITTQTVAGDGVSISSPSPAREPSMRMSTPVPGTPSPSKFSFKVGGGGDKLYSPSSMSSPSPRKTGNTPNKLSSNPLWIVPMDSILGQRLSSRITSNAKTITIKILDEAIDVEGCETILMKIIQAQCIDRYVREQERIVVSFRGQHLEIQIVGCTAEDRHDHLTTAMAALIMDDDTRVCDRLPCDSEVKRIERAFLASSIYALKVSHSTRVMLAKDEKLPLSTGSTASDQYVAGLSSTLTEVKSLLESPLKHPEVFQGSLKAPRGILLYGFTGSGKTCMARQLVEHLRPVYDAKYVNCVSLQSKTAVVGEAERELSRLFETRETSTRPVLLIMDDIHLICPKRGSHSQGTDRLAATLLSLIDGIDSEKSHFMVLAITNSPSSLDPALRRPGRLDTEVEVPLPDEPSSRVDIIQFHLRRFENHLPSLSDDDWSDVGKLAKGFNGADCMLAVKEAVRFAIRRQKGQEHPGEELPKGFVTLDDLKKAIANTKPSAIKSITVEIPQVKWSDIGGMASVKEQLREAIETPLTHKGMLDRLGIPAPRGILLYGPPGCSKTLMARALATEGQMNFLAVKGPELLSKWLGESERALAALFRRARIASPSIIFFDEIDAIAIKRGRSDSSTTSRLLSQLLTELDGIMHAVTDGKNQRVVVVGATNRPDLLDPALTRPGRIDQMIYVGIPDLESRKQIFAISLRNRACSDDVDIQRLSSVEVSGGFSGAEIVALCRDAALLALEESDDLMSENRPLIQMSHLLAAANEMKRQITPEMLEFYSSYGRSISEPRE